jgi:lysophospholipase
VSVLAANPLDFQHFSPIGSPAMTLVSIPANPVPEDVVAGTIKTSDGAELRFARWAPPAGRKGTVCVFTGRSEHIEKYFETVRDLRERGFAVAMIDWRGQGHSSRRLRDPRKGYVRDFSDYEVDVEAFVQQVVLPDCPPPYFALAHSMGGAVMLRIAHAGKRWFDRMVLSAPMIDLPGHATSFPAVALLRLLRLAGQGGRYIPGGGDALTGSESFINNPFTSDPVRYARNAAILEEDPTLGIGSPTVAWADTAVRTMRGFRAADYPRQIRQPILMLAASNDTIVSTAAIEEFAYHLRAGSHLVIAGARHEILQEQDRYRSQFWAAFDAFVPGTPLFK